MWNNPQLPVIDWLVRGRLFESIRLKDLPVFLHRLDPTGLALLEGFPLRGQLEYFADISLGHPTTFFLIYHTQLIVEPKYSKKNNYGFENQLTTVDPTNGVRDMNCCMCVLFTKTPINMAMKLVLNACSVVRKENALIHATIGRSTKKRAAEKLKLQHEQAVAHTMTTFK